MASLSQVQCHGGHELHVIAGDSSMAATDNTQAPGADPSGGPVPNVVTNTQTADAAMTGVSTSSAASRWLEIGLFGNLPRGSWSGTSPSGTNSTVTGPSVLSWMALTSFAWTGCATPDGRQTMTVSWSKIIAFAACVTTIVALWPTHQSSVDGSKSLALSRWTAAKDFYEFCEAHDWVPPDCAGVRQFSPGHPPDVKARNLKQTVHEAGKVSDHSTIVTIVCMAFVVWLLVLARRRRGLLARGLGRYILRRLQPDSDAPAAQFREILLRTSVPSASQDTSGFSSAVSSGVPAEPRPTFTGSSGGIHHRKSGRKIISVSKVELAPFYGVDGSYASRASFDPYLIERIVTASGASTVIQMAQPTWHRGTLARNPVNLRGSLLRPPQASHLLGQVKWHDARSPGRREPVILPQPMLAQFTNCPIDAGLEPCYKLLVWHSVCMQPNLILSDFKKTFLRVYAAASDDACGSKQFRSSCSKSALLVMKTRSLPRIFSLMAYIYEALNEASHALEIAHPDLWSSLLACLLLHGIVQKARQDIFHSRWKVVVLPRKPISTRKHILRAKLGEALQDLQIGLPELSYVEARAIWELVRNERLRGLVLDLHGMREIGEIGSERVRDVDNHFQRV